MRLEGTSPLIWISGFALLGGLLYVLQRLKPRRREQPVPSLVLWRKTLSTSPARHLRRRFQNLPAYLLSLLICGLLWLAFGEPRRSAPADGTRHVIVLDGSAALGAGERLSLAKQKALALARSLPPGSREVLWSGARLETLLAPTESPRLLEERLKARLADETRPSLARTLTTLGAEAGPTHPVTVHVVTWNHPPATGNTTSPFFRVETHLVGPEHLENQGIVAFGLGSPSGGADSTVDAYLEIASTAKTGPLPVPRVTLDGKPVSPESLAPQSSPPGTFGFLVRSLPANGGLLKADLPGNDALAADDSAALRLPGTAVVRVLLSPSLKAVLSPLLAADPGVELVDSQADVVIRKRGEPFGAGLPALEFDDREEAPDVSVRFPRNLPKAVLTRELLAAMPGACEASRADAAGNPTFHLLASEGWAATLAARGLPSAPSEPSGRSFALLVGKTLRWLGNSPAFWSHLGAGTPWVGPVSIPQETARSFRNLKVDTLGGTYAPPVAGTLKIGDGKELPVSLLDRESTLAQRHPDSEPATGTPASFVDFVSVLLAAVLALLCAEWCLYRLGRIP